MFSSDKTKSDDIGCTEEEVATRKNLVGAAMTGLLAILTMVFSLRLAVPGSIYTAPGLLPFIVGFTLFFDGLNARCAGDSGGGID